MIQATPQRKRPPRRVCAAAVTAFRSQAPAPEPVLDDLPDVCLKDAAASVRPHRKRGRPRKCPPEGPGDAIAQRTKRKRGRPRKVCLAAADEAKAAAVPGQDLDGFCSEGLPCLGLPTFMLTPAGAVSPFWPCLRRELFRQRHAYCFLAVRSLDQYRILCYMQFRDVAAARPGCGSHVSA